MLETEIIHQQQHLINVAIRRAADFAVMLIPLIQR